MTAKPRMERGQRVQVLLNRGEADVYYPGVVLDPRTQRVQLDDYPYGEPIVEAADICDWRPAPIKSGNQGGIK